MPLVIKAKRNAVCLFQSSLAEDGIMLVLSYFYTLHHRLQRAFETLIMQKFVLKNFFKNEIYVRFLSNQFVVALYYFQFLVAEFVFAL